MTAQQMVAQTATQTAGDAAGGDEPPPHRPPHFPSFMWKCVQVLSRIVCAVMFDLKVYGARHVPAQGGVLLVSNHQSYLDPVLLAVKLGRPMSYLAKSELFRNPLFAWLIRSLNAFPLRQGKGDKAAIEQTIRRLRQGHLLAVFPEGTRTPDGNLQPIQRGAALVVRRANVPIVPCVLDGSFQAWPKGCKMFHSHPIAVMYGPALNIEGLKGDAIVALIDQTLHQMFAELRQRMARP
jgi:1-acyl-sn-glycerol-3-phosphate acyltransferase